EFKLILVVLGIPQWACLGIGGDLLEANASTLQDVEAFGVGSHETILDAVVHHLHEMPGTRWSAMQIALLFSRRFSFDASGTFDRTFPRCQRNEYGLTYLHRSLLSPAHPTVTTRETVNSSAPPHVNV